MLLVILAPIVLNTILLYLHTDPYTNHANSNYAFLNCVSGVNDKLPLNGTTMRPEIQEIQQHNLEVKSAACRAIKRPGRSEFN